MAAKHEVRKLLAADHAKDVLHMRLEIDRAVHQMRSLADASKGGGIDLVPGMPQLLCNTLVAPAAVPGSMHEDKRSHRDPLSQCRMIVAVWDITLSRLIVVSVTRWTH